MIQNNTAATRSFSYIIHLADIHIPNSVSRHSEYQTVFKNLQLEISKLTHLKPESTLVLIAGDVFHDARKDGKLSPNAILLFKTFVNICKACGTVVIIPGNHDNNITYQSSHVSVKKDALSCVLADVKDVGDRIHYLPHTGVYPFHNVMLYHTSVFDIDKLTDTSQYAERLTYLQKRRLTPTNCVHVGFLHCGIDSQQLNSGYVLRDCAFKVSDLEQYDITCLGDTHHHQFLGAKKNIAYPNSLIQQNYGESLTNHGFIVWDLNTFQGTMHSVPNPCGFVTIPYTPQIDLSTIQFAPKSRIRLVSEVTDTVNVEDVHNRLQKFTDVLEIKEKRNWTIRQDVLDIAQNQELTDHGKLVEYIKVQFPDNEAYQQKLIQKLTQDLKFTDTMDTGRYSCRLLRMTITNFQCYKGTHTLDFSKYPQFSTVSISGNNAAGKSTLIRALSNGIWGADKGTTPSLINNESKHNSIVIEFEQNSIQYRITRQMTIKGKQTLKFEKLVNQVWSNESLKHIKKTQKKLETFFGSKEDAKQTWLAEQGSSNTFINSKDNYLTFQHFTGTDKFDPIFQKADTVKKALERDLRDLEKQLPSSVMSVESSTNETLLQNSLSAETLQKQKVQQAIHALRQQVNAEEDKKQYGTAEDFDSWTASLQTLDDQSRSLRQALEREIPEEGCTLWTKEALGAWESRIQKHKENLLIRLPSTIIEKKQAGALQTNVSILEAQLQSIHQVLQEHLEEAQLEPETLQCQVQEQQDLEAQEGTVKQQAEQLSAEVQQLQVDALEKHAHQELAQELETAQKTVVILQSQLDSFVPNDQRPQVLQRSLETVMESVGQLELQLRIQTVEKQQLENDIAHAQELDPESIESGFALYKSVGEKVSLLTLEVEHAHDKVQEAKEQKDKFKALKFGHECTFCTKNKEHFQIDTMLHKYKCEKKILKSKQRQLTAAQKQHKDLESFVDQHALLQKVLQKQRELSVLEVTVSNRELELNQAKTTEKNLRIEIDDYTQNLQLHTKMQQALLRQSELNSALEKADSTVEQLIQKRAALRETQTLLHSIQQKLLPCDEREKLHTKYNTVVKIHALMEKQQEVEHNLNAVQLLQDVAHDNQELQKVKTLKQTLQNFSELLQRRARTENRIEQYQTLGGYNPTVLQALHKRVQDLTVELEGCTGEIARLEYQLKEFYKVQDLYRDVQLKLTDVRKKLKFATDYYSVVDPRSGFPNQLIKSKLEQYSKNVNAFVQSAGFHFTTHIQGPVYKADSKKQSQKLIIRHEKNGRVFSELSGAEKFIFNIGIQTTLGDLLSSTTPPLQCIDEGFSSLDAEHLGEIPQILNTIKSRFNLILFISHNELIKNKADFLIRVRQENKQSLFET